MARAREPRRDTRTGPVDKPISDIAPEDADMAARDDRSSADDRLSDQEVRQPARANDDEIRTRAYHRYEERGRGDGQADADWYEAEKELRSRR